MKQKEYVKLPKNKLIAIRINEIFYRELKKRKIDIARVCREALAKVLK